MREGETLNYSESQLKNELAIIDVTDPTKPEVVFTASSTCQGANRSDCRYIMPEFSFRSVAVHPEVILFDEPCSALDPISTAKVEQLVHELKSEYTVAIVTHNMQQAARVAEMTAFFSLKVEENGSRHGILVEYDSTEKIFTQPADERTEGYVTGRFG